MRLNPRNNGRKAISGIIAAVILFAMLFSVGASYFLFINNNNGVFESVLFNNANAAAQRFNEILAVNTIQTSSNHIGFYANNTGGLTANMTSYYLLDSTGNVLNCAGVGVPTPSCTSGSPFPVIINVGRGTANIPSTGTYVDTGVTPTSGATYTVKILTARGNVFSAAYPPTATALASQALSSGAIGDLYMAFSTFSHYNVTTTGCPASGTSVPGGKSSGYCLMGNQAQQGFTVHYQMGGGSFLGAWGVSITNYNPNHVTITVDEYSLLMQLTMHGSSGLKPLIWYMVGNSSKVSGTSLYPILQQFTNVALPYGVPTFLLFAENSNVCTSGQTTPCTNAGGSNMPATGCTGSNCPNAGSTAPTFIVTHGWKGIPTSQTANYGQNSPYVTVLYY